MEILKGTDFTGVLCLVIVYNKLLVTLLITCCIRAKVSLSFLLLIIQYVYCQKDFHFCQINIFTQYLIV